MNKREQTMLIFVLVVAGMLLLLLYSPWGSPDLYNNRVYFADNQGVNFESRIISKEYLHVGAIKSNVGHISDNVGSLRSVANAPKNGNVGDSQNGELNIEDSYSKRKTVSKITATNYAGANGTSNRVIAYNKIPKSSSAKRRSESTVNSDTSNGNNGGSEMSEGLSGAFASNSTNNSSVGNTSNQSAGISAVSVDLSLFSDSTAMQAADSAQKTNSDPGGDPTTEPVPVGEGWIFLLALAAIYIGIKRKLFLKLLVTKQLS